MKERKVTIVIKNKYKKHTSSNNCPKKGDMINEDAKWL